MGMTGRGRWYEAVGGTGLEVERDHTDPEYQWRIACIIRQVGKRRPYFVIRINRQEESYDAPGCFPTLDEAKAEALRIFRVAEVVEEAKA